MGGISVKLVFLFGDAAAGKMTVGQELERITDLRLFHNHMSIEPVIALFGTYNRTVVNVFREAVFTEFAKSGQYGLIFTYLFAFDSPDDWTYIEHVKEIFQPYGTQFFYVELIAPQEVRLERNRTENRLLHKPSKRDLEHSDLLLRRTDEDNRCVSLPGEIPWPNYLRIENEHVPAEEAARRIKEAFGL